MVSKQEQDTLKPWHVTIKQEIIMGIVFGYTKLTAYLKKEMIHHYMCMLKIKSELVFIFVSVTSWYSLWCFFTNKENTSIQARKDTLHRAEFISFTFTADVWFLLLNENFHGSHKTIRFFQHLFPSQFFLRVFVAESEVCTHTLAMCVQQYTVQ